MVIDIVWVMVIGLALYYFPGLALVQFFSGRLKSNLFFILFLSFLVWPFYYLLLASTNRLNSLNWLILVVGSWVIFRLLSQRFRTLALDTDRIFPEKNPQKEFAFLQKVIIGVLVSFFILVMVGKFGLPLGYIPRGDDKPRIQKAVAIAISPQTPLFYNLPISEMTIYYFQNIPSGLWAKFTNNKITVNQTWFVHTVVTTVVLLWLTVLLATRLFADYLQRFIVVFGLTFGTGLEFFLAVTKNHWSDHLEWWTDWVGLKPMLHTQISSFFTLYFWVNQHLFAGMLVIPLYFLLTSSERSKILTKLFIALILANLVGYSAFVFITIAIVYIVFEVARWLLKQQTFKDLVLGNFVIGGVGLALALPMILLFARAEKESYFLFGTNVFWFFENTNLIAKMGNLLGTAVTYYLVEFNLFFIGLVLGVVVLWKKKLYRTSWLYWALFLYLPALAIFFVRAMDDNNISMRSLIPTQIALVVITALVIGFIWEEYKTKKYGRRLLFTLLGLMVGLSLPGVLYDSYQRFVIAYFKPDPIYAAIDKNLPLNSIVLNGTEDEHGDNITSLGHRFSFKQAKDYNVTDYEYVAFGKIEPLVFEKDGAAAWRRVFMGYPQLQRDYKLYQLDEIRDLPQDQEIILKSDKFGVVEFKVGR